MAHAFLYICREGANPRPMNTGRSPSRSVSLGFACRCWRIILIAIHVLDQAKNKYHANPRTGLPVRLLLTILREPLNVLLSPSISIFSLIIPYLLCLLLH